MQLQIITCVVFAFIATKAAVMYVPESALIKRQVLDGPESSSKGSNSKVEGYSDKISIEPDMGKKPPRLSQTAFEPEDIRPTSKQPNYERSNGDQPTDKTSSSKESAGINPDDKRPNDEKPSGKQPTDKTSSGKQPNDEKPTSKTPNDKKPHRLSQTTLGPEDSNVSSRQVKKAGIRPSNADRCYKCASCVLGQDSDDEYSNNGKATNEKPTSKQPNYERPNGDQPTDKTSSSKESAGINLDDKRPNDKKPSGKQPTDKTSSGKQPNDEKPPRLSQTTLGPEDNRVSSRRTRRVSVQSSNADRCYKCASCVLGQDSDDEYSNNGKATNEKPTSKQPNYERPNGDQPTDKTSSSKESAGINLDDKRPNDKKPSGKPPNDENSDNGYQSPVKKASQYPSTNNVISKEASPKTKKRRVVACISAGGATIMIVTGNISRTL
ncbi:hypothetical protein BSLG_002935 [Batrachochytrium salamandrivorans]|nr:hypothetical protein BSLG_002935 [Batrachochytrium salamandrivorans]